MSKTLKTILVWVETLAGRTFRVSLPAKRIVCDRCEGTGSHVNPSIDGNGISLDEFDRDPDFKEAYLSGHFDVTCEECKGENVLDVVDIETLSDKMKARYYRAKETKHRNDMDDHYERMAGA